MTNSEISVILSVNGKLYTCIFQDFIDLKIVLFREKCIQIAWHCKQKGNELENGVSYKNNIIPTWDKMFEESKNFSINKLYNYIYFINYELCSVSVPNLKLFEETVLEISIFLNLCCSFLNVYSEELFYLFWRYVYPPNILLLFPVKDWLIRLGNHSFKIIMYHKIIICTWNLKRIQQII